MKCDWCGDSLFDNYEREGNGFFHPFCAVTMRRRLGKAEPQDVDKVKSLLEGVNPDNVWLPSFERAFDMWAAKHPNWQSEYI